MTPKEFYDNVVEMRKWQKKFFSTKRDDPKKFEYQQQSIVFEKIVDEEIKRVTVLLKEKQEPKLF